jgi:hypothetical protein
MSVSSQKRVYALRTCDSDLRGHGGFQWPDTGRCEAPDWKSDANCGNGLHGLLNGEGRGSYLDWSPKAKWLVCDITEAHEAGLVVDLSGKIKFPYCEVVHCGDQRSATQFLSDAGITGAIVGAFLTAGDWGTATAGYSGTATAGYSGTATAGYSGTATAGDWGTATAGYSGTATAGDWGTATAGDWGTATAGDRGTATAGDWGTATAGDWGTATAGDRGTVQVKWWDGERYRIATGYVGEGGIEANTPYRVEGGKLVEAGK